MKPTLKAFMDDITVLAKCEEDTNRVLRRRDELITWTRIEIQGKEIKELHCYQRQSERDTLQDCSRVNTNSKRRASEKPR